MRTERRPTSVPPVREAPEQVVATVTNGRKVVMPAWEDRLDPATIKSLAVYVHGLGGGK